MSMKETEQKLSNLINASFPFIYIPTWEEERVVEMIFRVISNQTMVKIPRRIFTWSQAEGFEGDGQKKKEIVQPVQALDFIRSSKEQTVFILKDFHVFFGLKNTQPNYLIIRKLRDLVSDLKNNRKTVIFISPQLIIPHDMQKEISVLDFPLPDYNEIKDVLKSLISGLPEDSVALSSEEQDKLIRAAQGLTYQEAENAFARAIVTLRGLNINALEIIHDEKNQVIKKTGILEFVSSTMKEKDIGGLGNLKNWLKKRNNSWLDSAKKYNIPAPKGVLITGVPGCGKSLTAKAMGEIWGLPLLKLDMGKIFSGVVGSSEENMRRAIATAEAVSPSVLWVDEIEKGLSGAKSTGDSGTSARIFATFLTWMQEKTKPVFVIATANDISGLPPELLRKGRFDEIFFVDLPTAKEREKIFELHLKKRLINDSVNKDIIIDDKLLSDLSAKAEGFVGAEIEQAVIDALYEAFFEKRGLQTKDLFKAINSTVPLSTIQREQIASLRNWAATRAVLATSKDDREEISSLANDTEDDGFFKVQGGRAVDY